MVRPFRFGVQTGPFDDPAGLRGFAAKIEDLGYAELFSSDHINGGGLNNIDPFLPLLVAAEATSTLRFGPLVLNNEFHNPVLLARTAASFDLLTDGRLLLGMGTGYARSEHEAAGIPLRSPGPRVTRFAESLDAIRSLLDTGSATARGDHVTVDIDDLGVRPAQDHVPILVGGHGPRVVAIAGRKADIFQFTGLTHEPGSGNPTAGGFTRDAVTKRHDWLKSAAGQRFAELELSALVQSTHLGSGAGDRRSELAARLDADESVVDETPFLLVGSTEQVIDKLHGLRDTFGIHHFVIRDPDGFAPVVAALAGQ